MANTYLTIQMITREAARVLTNRLNFANKIRRTYDDKFAVDGAKIGTTLNVRMPPRYVGRIGQAMQVEDATETQVPVRLTTQFGVDLQFSSQDLALNIDDFSKRFINPAVTRIANKIDADGLQLYRQVYNHVGVFGAVPALGMTYLQAGVRLDDCCAPQGDERYCVVSPIMQATIVNANAAVFNHQRLIGEQYRSGEMGEAYGFSFSMDQNIPSHTIGALGVGSVPATTANLTGNMGTVLATNAWAPNAALNEGDVISIAGLFGINPLERTPTDALQQFVVTAPCVANGAGAMNIPVSPAIILSGAQQTCWAAGGALALGALVNVFDTAAAGHPGLLLAGTRRQGLAFHPDAFTFVTADLPVFQGSGEMSRVSSKSLGLSIRMWRQGDIRSDQLLTRLDILYGWAALRPELACRVSS